MADLVTSAEAKTFLGVGNTDDDTLIGALIDYVSAAIERYCGKAFSSSASRSEYCDGGGSDLILTYTPVTAIASIVDTFDDDAVVTATDYSYDGAAGLVFPSLDSEFWTAGRWDSGRRRFLVTYTGGDSATPDDVKLAALTWIADIYNCRDDIKSGSMGGITFLRSAAVNVQQMPDRVKTIIDKHRRLVF